MGAEAVKPKTAGSGLTLYHISPSRSSIVLWLLEEIGHPYELRVLNISKGENREPPFLAVNPMGKVPTLVHDGVVITEVGAVCFYLAETFAGGRLSVPMGDPRRAAYLKWMFFMHSCMEPAMMDRMLERPPAPRQSIGYGDFDTMLSVVVDALTPGPWMLAEQFTAADVVIGSSLRWGRMIGAIPEHRGVLDYVARLEARPALKRAEGKDEALAAEMAT